MNDYERLSIAYDGAFTAGVLIISVDGKKVAAGRKKNGGFVWTRDGKALLDALPKREPRPAPVEPVYDHNTHTVVKKPLPRPRKRRRKALETVHEADDK